MSPSPQGTSPEVPIPKSSKCTSHQVPTQSLVLQVPNSPSPESPCRRSVNVAFESPSPQVTSPEVPMPKSSKSPSHHVPNSHSARVALCQDNVLFPHFFLVFRSRQCALSPFFSPRQFYFFRPKSPSPNEVPIPKSSKYPKSPSRRHDHQVPFRRSVNVA